MPLLNKKKIRGWKRRVKHIELWKNNNIVLNLEDLKNSKCDYVKIWIDPFDRLYKRNPPYWYKMKIIEAMSEIFASWEKSLEKLQAEYYLKIWLYDPNFSLSQIVCGIDYKIEHYENTFHKSSEIKKLPEHYSHNEFLKNLNYELAIDDYHISSLDEYYNSEQMEKFKNKAYNSYKFKNQDGENEILYFIKKGNIWIGSK